MQDPPQVGVIGIIRDAERFLVIQRSQYVRVPNKYCFPGGGQEFGETDQDTLIRELAEEVGADISPGKLIWQSISPRGVELHWWTAKLHNPDSLKADPQEVAWIGWMTLPELATHPDLLDSNQEFFAALNDQQFELNDV